MTIHILIDTNIFLDIALKRPGLFPGSRSALRKCGAERHRVYIAWHTLSNLFYILRRARGPDRTLAFLRRLLRMTTVASVGQADAHRAFECELTDFEDALQLSARRGVRRRDYYFKEQE